MSSLGMFVDGFMRTDECNLACLINFVAAHISFQFWVLGNVRWLSYIYGKYIISIELESFLPG
jgi:hypothetical protein